ncbi:MAG: hypothetical protein J5801_00885 [Bacteroidales bacterium]|nr:hypothetical protein [Bacteroidales bacterium]
MKRFIFLLAVMLVCFASYAQSNIDGTWFLDKSEKQTVSEGTVDGQTDMKASVQYVFDRDRYTATLKAIVTMDVSSREDDTKANIYVEVTASMSGALSRSGDVITLTPEPKKKPSVDIDAKVDGVPGGSMIKNMIVSPLKKELTSELKKKESYTIVSVTESSLTLRDIPSKKEQAKGELPETVTFTRR